MLKTDQILKFQEEIENINEPTIVEGIKDKKQLLQFGFKKIFDISGKSLYTAIEKIKKLNCGSVIILTDFDKEGEAKAKALTQISQSHGIKVNSFIRHKFQTIFKIHKIEELNSITKFMEDDYYGKTCSINDKIFNRGRFFNRRACRKVRCYWSNIWTDRRLTRC